MDDDVKAAAERLLHDITVPTVDLGALNWDDLKLIARYTLTVDNDQQRLQNEIKELKTQLDWERHYSVCAPCSSHGKQPLCPIGNRLFSTMVDACQAADDAKAARMIYSPEYEHEVIFEKKMTINIQEGEEAPGA